MSKDIKFKIIVPAYNVEQWAEKNINSILTQKYQNFEVFYTDDISTDKTAEVVQSLNNGKIDFVTNTEKKFALRNIVESIERSHPDDEDVIVLVDGDDWLYHDNVLNVLKEKYEKEDLVLTYGSFVTSNTLIRPSMLSMYSDHVIENRLFRQDSWRASHLRTFKYKLWKNIKDEDLKTSNGVHFRMAWDLAIMFPMLEMAGKRFSLIEEPLYVYNMENPISDHKVSRQLQALTDQLIRKKRPYERIF